MSTQDTCCSIAPYFKVHDGEIDAFKNKCEQLVEITQEEQKCLYYGFSFAGNHVHCREGYEDAEGLLAHLKNIDTLLKDAFAIADLVRFEIHGPEEELSKLRGPLAELSPQFFVLEYGFRR